ncbi:hypothetical protein ACQKPE_05040 [Pseudomonas sp. NPDC089554]|uniref:hypothetical protein n=1 Tax=Pseudomonas sp. NPDC089554 TaxID=3390653 RepID=UPI003CFE2ED7
MDFDNVITAQTGEMFILPEHEGSVEYEARAHLEGISEDQVDGLEPKDGYCPGGGVNNGVCTPEDYVRFDWMERYAGVRVLPIGEAILLGTHNSGFDKKAFPAPSSETCQDRPINDQLAWGVRSLDLRVEFFSASQGARRFRIFHNSTNNRTVETDVLRALSEYRYYKGAHKEIVILNFHRFNKFTYAAHDELRELIKRYLGKTIVPVACKEAAIVQLWAMGMNTVVSYNHTYRDASFWPGVQQRWIGKHTPSENEMANFILRVAQENKGFGDLRAIQAAYYSLPFFVPKDLSRQLITWFSAWGDHAPIQGHYIINTDWSLRQRLADKVVYANQRRAAARDLRIIESSTSSGSVVQTRAYGIFSILNGGSGATLTFAANTSGSPSIQVITNLSDYARSISWAGQMRTINRNDCLVFRVPHGGTPTLLGTYNRYT